MGCPLAEAAARTHYRAASPRRQPVGIEVGKAAMRALRTYVRRLVGLHTRMLLSAFRRVEGHLPPAWACRTRNIGQRLAGRAVLYEYDAERDLYAASEGQVKHFFSHGPRGFDLYGRGLAARGRRLVRSYFVDLVHLDEDDIVIDCGANFSDLYLYLRGRIKEENYFAFEPGGDEFRAVSANSPRGRHYRVALGDRDGTTMFFMQSGTADSSVIEPEHHTHRDEVPMQRLDTLLDAGVFGPPKDLTVRLLKLEAEGFEPEILAGAQRFLRLCDYVAIDGGAERGIEQAETFSSQTNLLLGHGFELLRTDVGTGRALFRRRGLAEPMAPTAASADSHTVPEQPGQEDQP